MATLLSDGLIFSISPPCKKQTKKNDENDDSNIMLILAPFNKIPKINFGQIRINKEVTRNLLIINPQEFSLNLVIRSESLNINKLELNIDKKTTINFKLIWKPVKIDKCTFKINIEIKNSRLKFQITAFGECIGEPAKKGKKQTILQPVRQKFELPNRRLETTYTLNSITNNATQLSEILYEDDEDEEERVVCNLTRTQSICNQTPRFSDFNRAVKYESRILNSTVIKTTSIEKFEQKFDQTITYSTINVENEYKVRHNLYQHSSDEDEEDLGKINEKKKLKAIIRIQKWIKNKKERIGFLKKRRELREKHEKRVKSVLTIQRWSRSMKQRYEYLHQYRIICKIQLIWRQKYEKRVVSAIKIQRWTRSMKPRFDYLQLCRVISKIQLVWRQKFEKRTKAAVKIQRWTRSMKLRYLFLEQKQAAVKIQRWSRSMGQRYQYLRQYHAVCLVQKLWRIQLYIRVQAALIIQKWSRSMKQRYQYLYQYRLIRRIQQLWREKHEKRVKSAVTIQRWSRSMKKRYEYLHQCRIICKIQQIWRQKYEKRVESAIKIQRWTRSMKPRFCYLEKRSIVCEIQRVWRIKYLKRVVAATLIQRQWRFYRTRVELEQKSALLIQNKWRNYKIRQLKREIWANTVKNHLKLVHITKLIYLKQEILSINIKLKQAQCEYKAACTIRKYWQAYKLRKFLRESFESRRSMCALKIQLAYRRYKLIKIDLKIKEIVNDSAKIIQSAWRAYRHRQLNSLKFVKPSSLTPKKSTTIGDRFRHLLGIFQSHSLTGLSISQLVAVLIELCNLTSVSYECCFSFIHSSKIDTIDLLFRFIRSCNRSQPHIDLLNICLKLILNLIKCKSIFKYVVVKLSQRTERIEQLLGLLKSFYLNNCQLFVNSSVLLMILASNNATCFSYLKNGESLNILFKLKELINKRANLKLVNLSENYCSRAVVNENNNNKESSEANMITNSNVVSILKLNFKKPIDSLNYLLINILKV